MVNIEKYLSHRDKKLIDHTKGVVAGVKRRTNSKIAELSAIFHDVGKMNPNFQEKLKTGKSKEYSNHSYLSAYVFLCYCGENYADVKQILYNDHLLIRSVAAIIAHHHGNLPDFEQILSNEKIKLDSFLQEINSIPFSTFIKEKLIEESNNFIVFQNPNKEKFLNIRIIPKEQKAPLNLYLDTQFAFASLIAADKEDASNYIPSSDIENFCKSFNINLKHFIDNFKGDTELNRVRTKIREEAQLNLKHQLDNGQRIFSLTSPTGSGKTVMLLNLAGEILKSKGDHRIIYSLPFLSITEQVEGICNNIFKDDRNNIARIDSKSENKLFEQYQKELDVNPEANNKIINAQFADDLFDYPFIITTFVKLFETMLSNKNSTLLKLPNFANTIFLIDEIQALPPRLYGFFTALLDKFCKKFNSFAIISTATMPNFELPSNNRHDLKNFFSGYFVPSELVSSEYFNLDVFNRYQIKTIKEKVNIEQLASLIIEKNSSALVILNTIEDTKLLFCKLYELAPRLKTILLNTHFIPLDRKKKIRLAKWLLIRQTKVILISTQLIEAGVDIDFPLVFRDMAPVPNIIQSAGRGNRNGLIKKGAQVVIFQLTRNGKSRASLIYKGMDKELLTLSINELHERDTTESQLLEIQKKYFHFTQQNLIFGCHQDLDLIEEIKRVAFESVGRFQLINKKEFGNEVQYYIPRSINDNEYEKLELLHSELQSIKYGDFEKKKVKWIEIENQIRKMTERILQVRIKSTEVKPMADKEPCFQIHKLSISYNNKTGIDLSNANQII